MSHYLLQDKSKDFAGIYKEVEDKKECNENYYWNWLSFFGNNLSSNLNASPRLHSLPQGKQTHLKECCWSFAVSGQDAAHFVVILFGKKKKNLTGDYS